MDKIPKASRPKKTGDAGSSRVASLNKIMTSV